jgi:hypothetical protein
MAAARVLLPMRWVRAGAPRCGHKIKKLTVIPARSGNPWVPLIISKRHATS